MIANIDALIRDSLSSLTGEVRALGWSGQREREVVSLFCFGHLLTHCKKGTVLYDPKQVAIEVAVPQVADQVNISGKHQSKLQVCKDIVIWPRPRMTCWDAAGQPTVKPMCIIEWKHNEDSESQYDVAWMHQFSAAAESFVGYAVLTKQREVREFQLSCSRIYRGEAQSRWLSME